MWCLHGADTNLGQLANKNFLKHSATAEKQLITLDFLLVITNSYNVKQEKRKQLKYMSCLL